MKFHFPSFLLGYGAGAATAFASKRVRPLLLEILAAGYRLADSVAARAVMKREDLEDLFAEARARARGLATRPRAGGNGHAPSEA